MSYDAELLLSHAQQNIGKYKKGEHFVQKDLLAGIKEYDELLQKDKMAFGKYFKNQVENSKIPNVKVLEKNSGQTRYEKI